MEKREVDYIIVGFGLAGMSFASILENEGKSFIVFEDASQTSSNVAGGVYNPVILKRFTAVWQGEEQMKIALPFYRNMEKKFNKKYDYTFDTYRIFNSIEEQNNWFSAADKPLLSSYIDTEIVREKHEGILSNYDYGRVKHTGRIDTKELLLDYRAYLENKEQIQYESFEYSSLELKEELVIYKDIQGKKVVFCEGFGMHKNPYFKSLPMNEAKGELLIIYAPKLDVDFLIKSSVFVLPLGNHYYKVGATFNWSDKTLKATSEGRKELVDKLNTFLTVSYEIVEQYAGIRPTVKDRRPLVGVHPQFSQLAILNGLGTRGVMIAPKFSKQLYNHIEHQKPLDKECDIKRFENLF